MKKNITYVDGAKFEAIIEKLGLSMVPQAGFVKVSGAKGRNLYVARTKRVGRVDLSGFEVEFGVVNLGGESFGAVKQQLDFSLPEDDILANFEALCMAMKELPAREPEKKASPLAPAGKPKAQGWSSKVAPASKSKKELEASSAPEDKEELTRRQALLDKVAKEKGVKVSTKTAPAPAA